MKKSVLELRPTQFALGMREVEDKIVKILSLQGDGLKAWLDDHAVPCVLGPKGHIFLIDHHHFVSACYHAGVERVPVTIEADKQALTVEQFWAFMTSMSWVYPYDQFGKGPYDPRKLPLDIRCMADDPYRSLAWELRKAGVIEKVQKPFAEFVWAQWLRERLPFDLHHETWDSVVKQALHLAKTRPTDPARAAR